MYLTRFFYFLALIAYFDTMHPKEILHPYLENLLLKYVSRLKISSATSPNNLNIDCKFISQSLSAQPYADTTTSTKKHRHRGAFILQNRVRYTVFKFLVEVWGFANQRLLPKVNRVQPKGVHTALP